MEYIIIFLYLLCAIVINSYTDSTSCNCNYSSNFLIRWNFTVVPFMRRILRSRNWQIYLILLQTSLIILGQCVCTVPRLLIQNVDIIFTSALTWTLSHIPGEAFVYLWYGDILRVHSKCSGVRLSLIQRPFLSWSDSSWDAPYAYIDIQLVSIEKCIRHTHICAILKLIFLMSWPWKM